MRMLSSAERAARPSGESQMLHRAVRASLQISDFSGGQGCCLLRVPGFAGQGTEGYDVGHRHRHKHRHIHIHRHRKAHKTKIWKPVIACSVVIKNYWNEAGW